MEEIRAKVWNGSIPTQIVLSPEDGYDFDTGQIYFTQFPRISYIPIQLPKLIEFFANYLKVPSKAKSLEGWWLEFENVPLKWHWPIGLVYDLYTGLDPDKDPVQDHLPWTLVLHCSQYPQGQLLALNGLEDLEELWKNQLKEADFIRRGNANTVMSLSKDDSTCLWESLANRNCDAFWSVTAQKLLPSDPHSLKHIPVKVYLPASNKVLQNLTLPFTPSGQPETVGSALRSYLPALFPSPKSFVVARPVLHGIVLPMNAPLNDLLYTMMYSDGFLHLSLVMIS